MEGRPPAVSSVRRRRTAVERSSNVSRHAAEDETLTREGMVRAVSRGTRSRAVKDRVRRTGQGLQDRRARLDVHHRLVERRRVVNVAQSCGVQSHRQRSRPRDAAREQRLTDIPQAVQVRDARCDRRISGQSGHARNGGLQSGARYKADGPMNKVCAPSQR